MFNGLREQLIGQEVIFEQYRSGAAEDGLRQAQQDVEGAVVEITTTTLTQVRSGQTVALDLPQALGTGDNPTFNSIDVVDDVATRTNLGLGEMAVADRIAAITDLSQTISNPPTQAEVQAISDKVDEILAAARTANHLAP